MRVLLVLLLVCISNKTYSNYLEKKIRVDLIKKLYPKNYLDLPEEAKSVLEPSIMFGGNFIYGKNASCTLALLDGNGDGSFNEIGFDYIVIGSDDSSMYIHPSIQASEIAPVTYVSVENLTFKVENIDPQGKFIILSVCDYCNGSKDIKPTIKLFTGLPNISFENVTGATTDLSSFLGKGRYIYIEFWATWCHPCVESIPELKELYAKYKNQTFFISLNYKDTDKAEIKQFVSKNDMSWVNGFSTRQISAELLQNGFPYGILFDENGQVLQIDLHPSDLKSILSKYLDKAEAR